MPFNVSNCLPSKDTVFNTLNYCPGVSTFFNVALLIQKTVHIPLLENTAIYKSPYYTLVDSQSYVRCFFLLIPGASILVGIYDFATGNYNDKQYVLKGLKDLNFSIWKISDQLKNDPAFILEAVKIKPFILPFISGRLIRDSDFLLTAIEANGEAIRFVPRVLQINKKFVIAAIENNYPSAIQYAFVRDNANILCDVDLLLSAIQKDGTCIQYVKRQYFNNDQYQIFVEAAINQNPKSNAYADIDVTSIAWELRTFIHDEDKSDSK